MVNVIINLLVILLGGIMIFKEYHYRGGVFYLGVVNCVGGAYSLLTNAVAYFINMLLEL